MTSKDGKRERYVTGKILESRKKKTESTFRQCGLTTDYLTFCFSFGMSARYSDLPTGSTKDGVKEDRRILREREREREREKERKGVGETQRGLKKEGGRQKGLAKHKVLPASHAGREENMTQEC